MSLLLKILGLLPSSAIAANLDFSRIDSCVVPGLSCLGLDAPGYLDATLVRGALFAFGGILIACMILYGILMVFNSGDENAVTEARQAFVYALFGTVIILGAALGAAAFAVPAEPGINPTGVQTIIGNVLFFIRGLLAAALIGNAVTEGVRLIIAQEEGQIDTAKKQFLYGLYGAGIVLLASPVVHTFFPVGDMSIALREIVGLANFLLTIFAFLAVFSFAVSGVMLIISIDESLKDKAKKAIFASLIAMIVVLMSYALLSLFVFNFFEAETTTGSI